MGGFNLVVFSVIYNGGKSEEGELLHDLTQVKSSQTNNDHLRYPGAEMQGVSGRNDLYHCGNTAPAFLVIPESS